MSQPGVAGEHPVRLQGMSDDLVDQHPADTGSENDRKLPAKMVMTPVDEPGNQTIIEVLDSEYNIDIDESFFSQQNMKKIR